MGLDLGSGILEELFLRSGCRYTGDVGDPI